MATLATGLEIGRRSNPEWRIGKMIGEGACGAVHLLESLDGSNSTKYAIKVASIPDATTPAKQKKAMKHNSDLLHYENLMYTSHLTNLRGTYIPELPLAKGPQASGEVGGFRYLVMERMEAPLWEIVPRLMSKSKTSTVRLGPVATHLLDICQAVHEKNLLVIDCKPENFMLASGKGPLEKTIRMIDLGLMQTYGSPSGHRPNDSSGMVGTPLYASLNLHDGNTPSRRDDLEAIGYVISELCLRVLGDGDDEDAALPWSAGKSDDEIKKIKEACMTKPGSKLFSALSANGNAKVESIMREYFSIVRALAYKQNPDYDTLHTLLAGLKLSIVGRKNKAATAAPSKKVAATATNKKAPAKAASAVKADAEPKETKTKKAPTAAAAPADTRRQTRASKRNVDYNEESATKKQHVDTILDDESMEVESDEETFITTKDEDTFITCEQGEPEAMEWEHIDDGKPRATRIGVKVLFTDGPHEGETIILANGERESVTVGADPSEADGYSIVGDSEVDKSHVKLVLKATKKLKTVMLKDLKSAYGTKVNGVVVNKEQKLFMRDSVSIGVSTFTIVPIPEHELLSPAALPRREIIMMDEEEAVAPLIASLKPKIASVPRVGVAIICTAGPYQGESIELIKGKTESIVFGAKPSGDSVFVMSKDSSITNPSHVRLELVSAKTFFSVLVKDLKSTSGTSVNEIKIGKGKDQKAFMNDEIKLGSSTFRIAPLATSQKDVVIDDEDSVVAKENKVPAVKKRAGVSLVFKAGPYKGESIKLVKGQTESIVLGAKPSGDSVFVMPKDTSISNPSHVRIELVSAKTFFSVLVTDLKSISGTSVNGIKLGKGKSQKVFMKEEISIGNSVIEITTM
jgi:serine/threonine protein kinase